MYADLHIDQIFSQWIIEISVCHCFYLHLVIFSFSMTLVDTLDTLAIIGDYDEFEHAIKLVVDNVKFDSDIIVSVFETNIRMVGYV